MINVKDMTPQQLNYVVASIEGYKYIDVFQHQVMVSNKKNESYDFDPCRNWYHGGEIIAREKLDVRDGDLIAAMREYVYRTGVTQYDVPC